MINYVAYRKFATLKNGKRVMFRFLNEQDREALIRCSRRPEEDIWFLKQDVKDQKLVNAWVDKLDYRKYCPWWRWTWKPTGLSLTPPSIAQACRQAYRRDSHLRRRGFRNLGLGSLMLEEILNWRCRKISCG